MTPIIYLSGALAKPFARQLAYNRSFLDPADYDLSDNRLVILRQQLCMPAILPLNARSVNAGGKDELMLSIRFLLGYLSLGTTVQGVLLCFFEKEKGGERFWRSDAYLRLRLSMYSDAANAEKATTATALNSGTGMLFCSR